MAKGTVSPLTVSERELQRFNSQIGPSVKVALDLDRSRHLQCQKYGQANGHSLAYGLVDTTRPLIVANERRGENHAFSILQRRDNAVLLSVMFTWQATGVRNRFVAAQFVVYLLSGAAARNLDTTRSQQIMRLEWEGRSAGGTFEAPNAGHPHWQIDAIPSSNAPSYAPTNVVSMEQLDSKPSMSWLSRIHLASAAEGWARESGWSGDEVDCHVHANSPETLDALQAWTRSGARYLYQQLNGALP